MYRTDGRLVVSATDLVGFLLCEHLTTLSGRVAAGALTPPVQDDPELEVLRERGLEHEAAYLEQLTAQGLSIVRVSDDDGTVAEQQQVTAGALDAGADVVFQGAFWDDSDDGRGVIWRGHADFLRRVEGGYEPEDTKLARHVKASAVLQLCNYAEQLGRLQGHDPEFVHVVLGGHDRVSLRYREFASYYRLAKARFLAAVASGAPTEPYPVAHCNLCRWHDSCERQWVALDRPWLVAGIGREQARKLAKVGITTVEELATGPETVAVKGMSPAVYVRARRQAGLQLSARALPPASPPPYELLEPAESVGLSVLPEPSPGDLFFDMEGDPFVGDHGIEYLFGVGWLDEDGEFVYRSFWGHTPAEERAAFEAFVDFVQQRRAVHPDLHVYHYAAYERTALGKLMGRHATREDEVDSLFRDKVLVDLYRVVRQSVAVGVPSYSIKKLEPLYMGARDGEITDAASSIVEYERWLRTNDDKVLAAIEDYNLVDCRSTWLLRDWLEARRDEATVQFGCEVARPRPPAALPPAEDATETARLASLLVPDPDQPDPHRWLLAQLLDWHRREAKPEWWQYFRRVLESTDDDHLADSEAIGGLEFKEELEPVAKSRVFRYAFDPEQEYKLAVGKSALDPATERIRLQGGDPPARVGDIVALDGVAGTIDLRRAAASSAPHPRALIPGAPIGTKVQQESLRRMAEWVIEHGFDAAGSYQAGRDLLVGRLPSVAGVEPGAPLRGDGESLLDAAIRCARSLRRSYLPIQGPPGSGKTWTATRVIVDLVGQGKRVGITANSHAVIGQLLCQVADEAARAGVELRAMQKADEDDACGHPAVERAGNDEIEAACAAGEVDVVAGTAWLFARPGMFEKLDYLVVDEAGQLSLANVVAVAQAAHNLILVGDPQQLAQPSKGAHPEGAGVSGLDHVLGEHATIPPERGLFLDHTRRMHPAICRFISELAYEDRLESIDECANQVVTNSGVLAGAGLRWVPVEHEGNRTSSEEEALVLDTLFRAVLNRPWVDAAGQSGWLTVQDLLVVAPYNAQVALLSDLLPAGARVGTVDKFQGQEAPVVFVSLAASSADDVPRGMQFLYSRNRLNVAVSRARALSVLVASPTLLRAHCRSVEQLRLANGLCRYVELATELLPSGAAA